MEPANMLTAEEIVMQGLWKRLKAGDGEALDELARLRYRLLFNYATRFTRDRELIKDVIQDLFLELWDKRNGLMSDPYVTIYLIRALRNNLLRKLRLEKRLDIDESDGKVDPTDGINAESTWICNEVSSGKEKEIRHAIERLPKRQQEAIYLRFYEGLSNEEIATVMELERQTVANFLYRALTRLRDSLLPMARRQRSF